MKKSNKNKKVTTERNIDMVDHGYRVKALGLPERVVKKALRILVFLIPLGLVIFWFIKTIK